MLFQHIILNLRISSFHLHTCHIQLVQVQIYFNSIARFLLGQKNHGLNVPRVSASDDGIWRRLIVIPFGAKIEGKTDIKNYSEYLYENAGESILAWVIEGAMKVIALGYQIPIPDCVTKAIEEYRSQNDWFGHFLDEKCEVDDSFKESSSSLYQAYRNYSLDCNEYVRSTADFYFALEKAGFERLTLNRKRFFKGLRIREDTGAEEDFLQ